MLRLAFSYVLSRLFRRVAVVSKTMAMVVVMNECAKSMNAFVMKEQKKRA
jgi:hypothetical protein